MVVLLAPPSNRTEYPTAHILETLGPGPQPKDVDTRDTWWVSAGRQYYCNLTGKKFIYKMKIHHNLNVLNVE